MPHTPASAATPTALPRTALVTGASSGIGRATALRLASDGVQVLAAARREDRLTALAAEASDLSGSITPVVVDVSDEQQVAALAARAAELFPDGLTSLINIAGGALGVELIESADYGKWAQMYASNVIGAGRVTTALLPLIRKHGGGDIVFLTSTAGQVAYEGGAGYNAAKAGEHMIAAALRLELAGEPIRVIEVAPGLVHTEEFSLVRLGGDEQAAQKVYEGVAEPLVAADVADVIADSIALPPHVNLDLVTMRPVAQAAAHKLVRQPLAVKPE